jgi:hypothetical protein
MALRLHKAEARLAADEKDSGEIEREERELMTRFAAETRVRSTEHITSLHYFWLLNLVTSPLNLVGNLAIFSEVSLYDRGSRPVSIVMAISSQSDDITPKHATLVSSSLSSYSHSHTQYSISHSRALASRSHAQTNNGTSVSLSFCFRRFKTRQTSRNDDKMRLGNKRLLQVFKYCTSANKTVDSLEWNIIARWSSIIWDRPGNCAAFAFERGNFYSRPSGGSELPSSQISNVFTLCLLIAGVSNC